MLGGAGLVSDPTKFHSQETSTTYTILSPVHSSLDNIEYVDNNIDDQEYVDVFNNGDTYHELNLSDIYSLNEPFKTINDFTTIKDLPTIIFNNTTTNMEDSNTDSYIVTTNNNFDKSVDLFQQKDIVNKNNNDFIKYDIFKNNEDQTHNNPMISSGSIITNTVIPDDQYITESHQFKDNPFFIDNKNDNITNMTWTPLDTLNSSDEIEYYINAYQNNFNALQDTEQLDKKFMNSISDASFTINGNKIFKTSVLDFLHEFKKMVPDLESRQLLSSYAHSDIFKEPFDDLLEHNPNLYNCKQINPVVEYDIEKLDIGEFKVNATHVAELQSKDNYYYQPYKSIGVQVSLVLAIDKKPEVYYSSFLNE